MSTSQRVDVHTHIVPPDYRKWLISKKLDAGGAPIPEWSVEQAVAHMEALEIETGILSVSTPGVQPAGGHGARRLARDLNHYSAQTVKDHPGRFGFFATLSLPDIDVPLRSWPRRSKR
jgi:6-methylsalicylate decarboxylase